MLNKLLGIGSGLLSLGSYFSDRKRAKSQFNASFNESKRQFDQQMNESITRRVADAKNAGIHPLFALGASTGISPTMSTGGVSSASPRPPDMSALLSALLETTADEKRANTKASEADAAFKNAQTAKLRSDTASQGRDLDPFGDATYYSPEIPKSQSPGVVAGERPGIVKIKMPDGRTIENYDPDLGLDEIGQINYAIQRARHYFADMLMKMRPYASDAAILKKVKEVAGVNTPVKPNLTPPGHRHRTRQRRY